MSKKVIYLVVSAGSILAAGMQKFSDESVNLVPSMSADEVNPQDIWNELFPGKKLPLAAHLLEEEALENPENIDGQNLAAGVIMDCYDLNNPYHFQKIIALINEDRSLQKEMSAKGAIIVEAGKHEKTLNDLVDQYEKEEVDEKSSVDTGVKVENAPAYDHPSDPADNVIDINTNKTEPADQPDTNTETSSTDETKSDDKDLVVNKTESGNTVEGVDSNVASDGDGAKKLPDDVANVDGNTLDNADAYPEK